MLSGEITLEKFINISVALATIRHFSVKLKVSLHLCSRGSVMDIHDPVREQATQQRQEEEVLREKVLARAEAVLELGSEADVAIKEQAREQIAHHRQETEELREKVLTRAEVQLELASEADAIKEQAREQVAHYRQTAEALRQKVLTRTEEEIEA